MSQIEQVKIAELFTLEESLAGDYLRQFEYPWEALSGIHDLIIEIGKQLPSDRYDQVKEDVWIAKSASVFDSASSGGAGSSRCVRW